MVLNSSEKKLAKKQLTEEQKVLKALKSIYKKSLQDVQKNIADLNSRSDMQNLQSIIYQKKYQEALETQIKTVLDNLNKNSYQTIEDYVKDSYVNGYAGNMWLLQQQTGLTCVVPIDERKVVRAYTNDSKISTRYYSQNNPLKGRIAEDVDLLKARIKSNVSRGIASGKTWTETAYDIASGMNSVFSKAMNDAMRIARTEGHRVNQQGFLDAGQEAINNGAEIVKQWDATLDSVTRPWHQEADGQIREWDEKFLVGGEEMDAPSVGGSAFNVCNCRCQLLQRAKWALDEDELQALEDRASFFGLDKTKDIDDFKDKYLQLPKNANTVKVPPSNYSHDVRPTTTKLKGQMKQGDYDEYMKLVEKNPLIAPVYDVADDINSVRYVNSGGVFKPRSNALEFAFPNQRYIDDGMSKFQTLAHEYGHYFDTRKYDGLTFNEINGLNKIILGRGDIVASSSDQFLKAMRNDKKSVLSKKQDVLDWFSKNRNTSTGLQDAFDGFGYGRVGWGHGDKYYNRFYNGRIKGGSYGYDYSKDVKKYYESLGLDASNQAKVKKIARDYETASELWANLYQAYTCGGKELETMKKYLPETCKAFEKIIRKLVK